MNTNTNRHSEALHAGDIADTPGEYPSGGIQWESTYPEDTMPTVWGAIITDTNGYRMTSIVTFVFAKSVRDVEGSLMEAFDTPYYRGCTFTIAEFAPIPF